MSLLKDTRIKDDRDQYAIGGLIRKLLKVLPAWKTRVSKPVADVLPAGERVVNVAPSKLTKPSADVLSTEMSRANLTTDKEYWNTLRSEYIGMPEEKRVLLRKSFFEDVDTMSDSYPGKGDYEDFIDGDEINSEIFNLSERDFNMVMWNEVGDKYTNFEPYYMHADEALSTNFFSNLDDQGYRMTRSEDLKGYAEGGRVLSMQEKLLETLPPSQRIDQQVPTSQQSLPRVNDVAPDAAKYLRNEQRSTGTAPAEDNQYPGQREENRILEEVNNNPSLFRRVFEFFMSLQPKEVEQRLQETTTPSSLLSRPQLPPDLPPPNRDPNEFRPREQIADGGKLDDQMAVLISVEPSKSMVPDEQMEEDYIEYVISNSLSPEEETYLLNKLEQDDELSMLFDKVIETASEFSGTGPVKGPGSEKSDSIPARLSDGEFVFTAKAVEEIGADNLQLMMEDAERASRDRQQAAYGGSVESMTRRNQASKSLLYKDDADDEIKKAMLSINPRMQ
jgi:hypothetical protein